MIKEIGWLRKIDGENEEEKQSKWEYHDPLKKDKTELIPCVLCNFRLWVNN